MTFKNQTEMFNWIWETREHVSELSGSELLYKGHKLWHWQFMHILPKGGYPSYKLNPDNIMLGLPKEHAHQERYPLFNEKYDKLRSQYYKEIYHKNF